MISVTTELLKKGGVSISRRASIRTPLALFTACILGWASLLFLTSPLPRPDDTKLARSSAFAAFPQRPGGPVGGPWFDVRDFGAVCDDAHDDTNAIQAAIKAVPPRGGVVIVPPGICKITAPLNLKPDLELIGFGSAAHSAIRQTANAPAVQLDNSCCRPTGPVGVRDLEIRTGTGATAHGLYLNNVFLALVDRVKISSGNQTDSHTIGGDGIRLVHVTNSSVLGATIGSANRTGIALTSSHTIAISNSLVTENLGDGIHAVTSPYLSITGNMITENNGSGVFVDNGGGFFSRGEEGTVVAGNVLRGNGKPLLDAKATDGVGVHYSKTSGTISANVASFNYGHGILLRDTRNVVVVGNDVSANGHARAATWSGVELEAEPGETTSGNVVLGNRIHDDQAVQTQRYSVDESGSGTLGPNLVEGNDLRGSLRAASVGDRETGTLVVGNLGEARSVERPSGAGVVAFSPVPARQQQERSLPVPGASAGMAALCSPSSNVGQAFIWSARVGFANEVLIRVANTGDTTVTPRAVEWQCRVVK